MFTVNLGSQIYLCLKYIKSSSKTRELKQLLNGMDVKFVEFRIRWNNFYYSTLLLFFFSKKILFLNIFLTL